MHIKRDKNIITFYFLDLEINIGHPGNDLTNGCQIKTNSSEECLDLCHKTANCKGFGWGNPKYFYCPMGCWLKSKMKNRKVLKNVISGFANFEVNIDYGGNDITDGHQVKTNTAAECLELCHNTSNCKGFSWAKPDHAYAKGCWVKKKMTNRKFQKNVISGFI